MRGVLMRMLIRLDEDPDFPHALVGYYEAFIDPTAWSAELLDALKAQLVAHASALEVGRPGYRRWRR